MSPTVTIFALYKSWDAAEFAADKLIQAGVTSSDISVLLPTRVPALSRDTIQPKLGSEATDVPGSREVFSGALTGGQDLCTVTEPSATDDVAATTESKPAPARRPKHIYIDRTMHRATPEEFEDEPRS